MIAEIHMPCGSFQRRIRKTFASAVRRNEVFQNGKSLAEARLDGQLYGFAARVCHESAHTGQLSDLVHAAARAGVCHHPDRIEFVEGTFKLFGNLVGGFLPDSDNFFVTLVVRNHTHVVKLLDFEHFRVGVGKDFLLFLGDVHIEYACGDRSDCRILVAERFYSVKHLGGNGSAVDLEAALHNLTQLLFAHKVFYFVFEVILLCLSLAETEILRNSLIENHSSDGGG